VRYPGSTSPRGDINHGTFFWTAYLEGLLRPNASIHAGIRTRLFGLQDYNDDVTAGFTLVHAFDIDRHGIEYIGKTIRNRVGDGPVYISLDIDVLCAALVSCSARHLY
jgi:agmatinase